jgi:uncharacterized low-complexity protein
MREIQMKKTTITSIIATAFSFVVFEAAQAQESGKTEDWKSGPVATETEADLIKEQNGKCGDHCGTSPNEDGGPQSSPPGGASGRISAP